MNTPPRSFAAPPPPPVRRKGFSPRLGFLALLVTLVGVVGAALSRAPPWAMKAAVLVPALAWAAHVASVVMHNRRLDRRPGPGRLSGPR